MADISIRQTPSRYHADEGTRAVPGMSRALLWLRERAHAMSQRAALVQELGGLTERERLDAGLPPKQGLHWAEHIALLFMQR